MRASNPVCQMTLRTILVLLLMAVAVVLAPRGAFAHASLVAAEPSDGAVLQHKPDRIVLQFSEPVSPLILRLIGPKGDATDLKQFKLLHQSVEITPPTGLPDGTYALSWRVVSADGHPISGSLLFSIRLPVADNRSTEVTSSGAVQVGLWSARLLMSIGAFAGVGGAFFAAWVAGSKPHGSARQVVVVLIWGGIFATFLSVGLQGLDALALPPTALGNKAVWLQGFETAFGTTAILVVLALLSSLFSVVVVEHRQAKALSAAALIAVGIAFAASGHAATAEPQWLTRTSVFIHVAGLVFWIGSLMPLFMMMLRADDPYCVIVLRRYSVAILPVVILLVLTGGILTVIQVGSFQALWRTSYGNLLLVKLLAVGGLLVLASLNRLVFSPALAKGVEKPRKRFAQSIGAEGVLVLLILGLVAGWRFTPPPRALAAIPGSSQNTAPQPVSVHIHTDRMMAQVTFALGSAGKTVATVRLALGSGAPLNAKEVVVALSKPSSGIEPFERHAVKTNEGTWRVDDLLIPMPGHWQVRVDALVSDFDKVTLEGAIEVRPETLARQGEPK